MIILTNREQFKNAIKRAKELKPHVWPGSTFGVYFVEGQSQDYRVQFGKVNGQFAATCTCPAHQMSKGGPKACYHLVSAYQSHRIQVGIRRQVKAAQSPSVSNWISESIEAA